MTAVTLADVFGASQNGTAYAFMYKRDIIKRSRLHSSHLDMEKTEALGSKVDGVESAEELDLVSQTYGIWTCFTTKNQPFDYRQLPKDFLSGFQFFRRLLTEIYFLSPRLLLIFILSNLWDGIETAVLMHLSSDLLRVVEVGQREGSIDTFAVARRFIARVSCLIFVALLEWKTKPLLEIFRDRVRAHYEFFLMKARMRLDIPTSEDPGSNRMVSAYDAWSAFEAIIRFFCSILTSASQLGLLAQTSKNNGGPFFAFLCIVKPLLRTLTANNLWTKELLVDIQNTDYLRMHALKAVTQDEYKVDYITGNLDEYIMKEYQMARHRLGDISTDGLWEQAWRRPVSFEVFCAFLEDLPLLYCLINAIRNPSAFSMASIAILQQSSTTLRWSINDILETGKSFQRHVSQLKNLYALGEVQNTIKDGEIAYPRPYVTSEAGMRVELKDITFKYGKSSKTNALQNVSLSFEPGQLVVIVGANGSGKSTLIKLLSRIYDVKQGELLIDGIPSSEYQSRKLRRSMAIFSQDHHLFPLSMYENIALGDANHVGDKSRILEAAKKGGAVDVLDRLKDGIDTVLDPMDQVWSLNLPDDPKHPLQKQKEKLEKKLDLSGGERQRIVAARTFMHLNSGRVNFVAVDEPSSALDPEAEKKLFERLLDERKGKTMVFVTHRFGYLTKHADLIICMKEGSVVEQGTHDTLISKDGEYRKLYDIQADAFVSTKDD